MTTSTSFSLSIRNEPPAAEIMHAGESRHLPRGATFLRILGVNYAHLKMEDEGELYVTEHGIGFVEHLHPQNWYEEPYFHDHRTRLEGSGTVYHIRTRPLEGRRVKSIELVVKWSRVGQDVPLNTFTARSAINAEFNSPFEEFSLVQELREGRHGPRDLHILTQKPLAIYVPPERCQLWQTGRSRERIMHIVAKHAGVQIDILRSYILIYAWVKGFNAVEAFRGSYYDSEAQRKHLKTLTLEVERQLEMKGFTVADHKPTHCILRMRKGLIRRKASGAIPYALVDYELLARTSAYDNEIKAAFRSRYLLLQRDRFNPPPGTAFPEHLRPAKVMGVDYVFGHAESTGGSLWVVGKHPELFGYFLPERWRTKRIGISPSNRVFYSLTKDRIHLVWKVSRLGELPPGDLADPHYKRLLMQGYNSPFEEFSLALEMMGRGIRVTYPRAIYVTAQSEENVGGALDSRRFERFKHLLDPDGQRVLQIEPDYVSLWGFWRGLDDDLAPGDNQYWTPIDALRACNSGLITFKQMHDLVERQRQSLARAGFEDMTLSADHILLTYIPGGEFKRTADGELELRHCNFEMVRQCAPDSQ